MMGRSLAIAALLLAASVVQAQQTVPAGKVHRIGIVSPTSPLPQVTDAFRDQLRELGYVEGRNLVIEIRHAQGRPERLPEIVAELIRLQVDVLVSGSTTGVLAAKKMTTTVPIVFATVFDPVGSGIVPSLARPGGNVTGLAIGVSGEGFGGKWAQLLKDVVPNLSRVSVLWSPTNPSSAAYLREVQAAARSMNVQVDVLDAGTAANLDRALAGIEASHAQGVIVTPDPLFHAHRARLVRFFESKRLPAIYFSKLFVDAGGLMSYGASFEDSWRKAAVYVDKILKGARPGDLPIEQPTKFELVVNSRTARTLGIAFPPLLLQQADHIVK